MAAPRNTWTGIQPPGHEDPAWGVLCHEPGRGDRHRPGQLRGGLPHGSHRHGGRHEPLHAAREPARAGPTSSTRPATAWRPWSSSSTPPTPGRPAGPPGGEGLRRRPRDGGHVLGRGGQNIDFVRAVPAERGHSRLERGHGRRHPRKVYFFPHTGQVPSSAWPHQQRHGPRPRVSYFQESPAARWMGTWSCSHEP